MTEISVLTYNMHLMDRSTVGEVANLVQPSFFKDDKRASYMIARMKTLDTDFLCLTEVWKNAFPDKKVEGDFVSVLQRELKEQYPYNLTDRSSLQFPGLGSFLTGSGLLFFSKHEIETQNSGFIKFGTSSFEALFASFKGGEDAFAEKGFLTAVIKVNGKRIRVITTHLQADAGFASREGWPQEVRAVQLRAITSYIDSQEKLPTLICGDFNVGKTAEYKAMLETMLPFEDAWALNGNDDPGYTYLPAENKLVQHFDKTWDQQLAQRLDYMFCNPDDFDVNRMIVKEGWALDLNGNLYDASDHQPLYGAFTIK